METPLYKKYITDLYDDMGNLAHLKINVPENFNFAYDVVDELALKKPDAMAMIWCDDKTQKSFTFSDMKRESDKTAAFFQSLGVKRGDFVMLILKRHYEWWFSVLALHKLGAVCIPATNQLQVKDLVYRFNSADVKMVVCTSDGEVSKYVDEAQSQCPALKIKVLTRENRDGWFNFEEGLNNAPEFVRPTGELASQNSDISILYFTSGTTGMPKMVAHSFTYPLGHIATAKLWHQEKAGETHLTVSETGWGKAVWGKLYGQWFMESVIFVYDFDRFDPDILLKCIEKYKITTFCAPPTIYRFLIRQDLSMYDLSSLRYATTAGEALNPEVYNRFYEATGIKLKEGFGQTETTMTVSTMPWMETKLGSMGMPSLAYNVDVVNAEGISQNVGEVGEIVVRTDKGVPPGMFMGYYKDEERTKSVWHDGMYHTGDMAWKDEDGYLYFVGRSDDIIKSSGYRIGPFEVESVLMEHDAVMECAVTGVPDPIRGMAVKATVVLAKGYEPSEKLISELQDYVKTHTAPYKYPRVIEFTKELPKTISGKIMRNKLRGDENKNGTAE